MIKVECTSEEYIGDGEFKKCDYVLLKPQWEHIVNALYSEGGHAGKNVCPKCQYPKYWIGEGSLVFDFDYK